MVGLVDGQTIAIIGGGPAGVSCAIALRHLAQSTGRDFPVVLYEGKVFRGRAPHYNQCSGVLSPPIVSVLESLLRVPFPMHLVQRRISNYVLHSDNQEIALEGEEDEPSYALRRVQFDDYLLDKAREAGVTVISSRVADLEWHDGDVVVYADSESRHVAAVVGAFGLDEGTCRIFEHAVGYRQPKYLTSIVTKVHPMAGFLERMHGTIHAFLPSLREIEFGALTPKGNHITINIAGAAVDTKAMDRFLALPAVRRVLPAAEERDRAEGIDDLQYFKGKFPISLARGHCGDRFVVIGDAAGLIRPFKGKGVTAGCASGVSLAEAMFKHGVSGGAFRDFFDHDAYCSEIRSDLPYARALRWLASSSANHGYLDAGIALAHRSPALRRALYDSISAHRPYRDIVRATFSLPLVVAAVRQIVFRR